MEVCGYPHLEHHRRVHDMQVKQARMHLRSFEQDSLPINDLIDLLRDWFFDHNMGMDKAIAEFAVDKEDEIISALENIEKQV